MLTVEEMEKSAEVPKKQKQPLGTLFKINPHERLEKKEALKSLVLMRKHSPASLEDVTGL